MTWRPVIYVPIEEEAGSPTTLYRLFDAAGVLLYVGISGVPFLRWKQHGQTQPWWPRVTKATVQHFATRQAALEAELTAIREESPLFNATFAVSERSRSRGVTLMSARRTYRKLAAKGPVTGSAMGAALGVSAVMGRKWLRRVRPKAKAAA